LDSQGNRECWGGGARGGTGEVRGGEKWRGEECGVNVQSKKRGPKHGTPLKQKGGSRLWGRGGGKAKKGRGGKGGVEIARWVLLCANYTATAIYHAMEKDRVGEDQNGEKRAGLQVVSRIGQSWATTTKKDLGGGGKKDRRRGRQVQSANRRSPPLGKTGELEKREAHT